MSPKGVVICCNYATGTKRTKSSGVLFDGGVALTCGTLLQPLVYNPESKKMLQSILRNANSELQDGAFLEGIFNFSICLAPEYGENDSAPVLREYKAVVCGIWKCPLVLKSIEEILDDWTFEENVGNKRLKTQLSVDDSIIKSLLSLFILLKIQTRKKVPICNRSIIENIFYILEKPVRGQHVVVQSTPFSSDIFFNSISRGIISNVIGRQNCLFLTDTTIVTGCEGGPVYSAHNYCFEKNPKSHLIGLINSILVFWRGKCVTGLALGVSLLPILRRLILPLRKFNNCIHIPNQLKGRNLLDETIVLIHCGEFWGTGLVVDAASGCIITCSHVLKNYSMNNIRAFHNGNKYSADLIFRTRNELVYDIAVIKISTPNVFNIEMEMDTTPAQAGETVIAAGFPLFNENKDIGLKPTIVHGCIAKTSPVMFQTTCCIQYGASGSAIIRNGKMLGMIVSNLRNSDTETLYPHINFAIPASVFSAHIKNYIETGNILNLENLECSDSVVQRTWRLEASKL